MNEVLDAPGRDPVIAQWLAEADDRYETTTATLRAALAAVEAASPGPDGEVALHVNGLLTSQLNQALMIAQLQLDDTRHTMAINGLMDILTRVSENVVILSGRFAALAERIASFEEAEGEDWKRGLSLDDDEP